MTVGGMGFIPERLLMMMMTLLLLLLLHTLHTHDYDYTMMTMMIERSGIIPILPTVIDRD